MNKLTQEELRKEYDKARKNIEKQRAEVERLEDLKARRLESYKRTAHELEVAKLEYEKSQVLLSINANKPVTNVHNQA